MILVCFPLWATLLLFLILGVLIGYLLGIGDCGNDIFKERDKDYSGG